MPDCALPPHLRNKPHNDWPFFLRWIDRGWNAYGPRCPIGSEGYRSWPPRLIEGRGVARWESSGAESILYIPALSKIKIHGDDFYDNTWSVVEMNPGNPLFLQKRQQHFPKWSPARVWDTEVEPGKWKTIVENDHYSPSALQKFSGPSVHGYIKLAPDYTSYWKIREQRELTWFMDGAQGEGPEDSLWYFFRTQFRPDTLDCYYNKSLIATAGLKWE